MIYDQAVILREPCENCGTSEGLLHIDDHGAAHLFCGNPDCNTAIQEFYESEV